MQEVVIPKSIKALVVLNLQSYAGGRDLFGLSTRTARLRSKGYEKPIFNDGLLEVRRVCGSECGAKNSEACSRQHILRAAPPIPKAQCGILAPYAQSPWKGQEKWLPATLY